MDETPRQRADKRLAMLKNERQPWEITWKDLSDYVLPMRSKFLYDGKPQGDRRSKKIINSTGTKASRTQSAGMVSGITSPARPWFQMSTESQEAMEFGPIKAWLYDVTQRMRDKFLKSNLYSALPVVYSEMGTFGIGAMSIEEDEDEVFRFEAFTVGQYYVANGANGKVDTFYREFKMTVGQLVEKFGLEQCSTRVKSEWTAGRRDTWVDCVQAVEPNKYREDGKRDSKNLPFASITYEVAAENPKDLLEEKGFHEFPIIAIRWDTLPEDSYATGPGHIALPDIKALQLYEKRSAQMVDRGSDPALQAPSSLRGQPSSMIPGGITYVDQVGGQNTIQPIYTPNPGWLGPLQQKIQELEQSVKESYFADLFLMISQLDDVRSATEIVERKEEKMLMLGPVLEHINDEGLDPLIDRCFNIMLRQSLPIWQGIIDGVPLLPPPPEELSDIELKVEYVSILAQAQRALGVASLERYAAFVGNLSGAFPTAADKMDSDQLIDEYANAIGVVPTVVRGDEQVAQIRQQRAQQQQAAQAQQVLGAGIQGAKLLSETEVTPNNALGQMLGA
ncbi:portal protein [Pseudomonas sp. GB2N2]